MKVIEVINLTNALGSLSLEKVDKEGKFAILDIIDEMMPIGEKFDKQQDEAIKLISDKSELSERMMEIQKRECDVDCKKMSEATFDQIMESNPKLQAGTLSFIRRMTVIKDK